MKSRRAILLLIGALVLITAVLAAVHFSTRETVPEGAVLVRQDGKERYVALEKLALTKVTGTIVNGKDEERVIDSDGVALGELAEGTFASVTVTSDDAFAATVNAEEIANAFLIRSDDGSARLVVFGDSNSKRSVRNVVRIEFNGGL